MSAHVTVALDTTAPDLDIEINGGDATTDLETVTLAVTAIDSEYSDDLEVRIWGAINPLDPANADYGETEGDAPWVPWDSSFLVALAPGGGAKGLTVKVRDAVWNEAQRSASIILTGEPITPPAPPPKSPPFPPAPTPGMERRMVTARSNVRVRTRVSRSGSRSVQARTPIRVRTRPLGQTRRVASRSAVHARTRVASSSFRLVGGQRSPVRVRSRADHQVHDSDEIIAILLAAAELDGFVD
jgi:hypothetical protein